MLLLIDNKQVAEINKKEPKGLSTHDLYFKIINGEFIELTFNICQNN